jgi:hypothetical protein
VKREEMTFCVVWATYEKVMTICVQYIVQFLGCISDYYLLRKDCGEGNFFAGLEVITVVFMARDVIELRDIF